MWSLLTGIFSVALARKAGIQYGPITQEQIPEVKSYSRVIDGNQFSIKYNNPEENEYTLIIFVESKMIDASSKKLKSDPKGIFAQLLYKVTPDGFFQGIGKKPVEETDAKLDRQNNLLTFVDNEGIQVAGYYWSLVMRDGETAQYRDFATDVHTVKTCGIDAHWTKPIEFNKFGWHTNSGKLSFNPVGFNPNDEFAICHFESNPPMTLSWNKDVGEDGKGQISARMPASNVYMVGGVITCSIKDEVEYSDDQCTAGFINKKSITMPPTRLQYAEVTDVTTKGKIWNYVDSESDSQVVEFACPLIDTAEMVKVVSFDDTTGKLWESPMKNQVSQELPEAAPFSEPELMTFIIRQNKYFINIDMKDQPVGVREFRCQYLETAEGPILGYSSPHIIVKYEEDDDDFDGTVVPQWGAGIDQSNPVVKETKNEVSIATCYQTTLRKPAELFLRFKTASGKWQHTEPSAQHFVAFNAPVSRKYDQAEISCGYRYTEDDDEDSEDVEEGEVTLGVIKVMFKPKDIKIKRNGDSIKCTGDISSMDTAHATLTINQNVQIKMVDGVAEFQKNQFTDEEFNYGISNGMSCVVVSDSFEGEFQSTQYCDNCSNNTPPDNSDDFDPSFEAHPGGPIALCLFGAAAVITICFKMPANKPPAEKGAYKVVECEDGDDIVRIDETPLDESPHSSVKNMA